MTMKNKILIIDDDDDILEALKILLTKSGYEVMVCKDGSLTSEKAIQFSPDLIILDVLLSGVDGLNICKILKSDKNLQKIPLIMFSAHPTAEAQARTCGADGFIAKPFTAQKLLEEIRKQID